MPFERFPSTSMSGDLTEFKSLASALSGGILEDPDNQFAYIGEAKGNAYEALRQKFIDREAERDAAQASMDKLKWLKDDAKDAFEHLVHQTKLYLSQITNSESPELVDQVLDWAGGAYSYSGALAAPEIVTAEGGSGTVSLNWQKVSGADFYIVKIDGDYHDGTSFTEMEIAGVPAGSHTMTVEARSGTLSSSSEADVTVT